MLFDARPTDANAVSAKRPTGREQTSENLETPALDHGTIELFFSDPFSLAHSVECVEQPGRFRIKARQLPIVALTKDLGRERLWTYAALIYRPGRAGDREKKEVPTFEKWFNGRFWTEWVVARKNKPSEVEAKKSIFKIHLGPEFGHVPLDQIDVVAIARFRAKLIEAGKSDKRINNILAVLSKALNYAEQAKVISSAPSVGMLKVERPEIVAWSLEEYARLLAAAKALDPMWYAACCLAGEAGLRVGEIRALDWRRDVDLVAGTLTVNRQAGHGHTTTPKGRTRRMLPMTETLIAALKALDTIRTGFVIRNLDGEPMTDNATKYHCYRICRAAGLPERGWHNLRHAFGRTRRCSA
jgi:integrase